MLLQLLLESTWHPSCFFRITEKLIILESFVIFTLCFRGEGEGGDFRRKRKCSFLETLANFSSAPSLLYCC